MNKKHKLLLYFIVKAPCVTWAHINTFKSKIFCMPIQTPTNTLFKGKITSQCILNIKPIKIIIFYVVYKKKSLAQVHFLINNYLQPYKMHIMLNKIHVIKSWSCIIRRRDLLHICLYMWCIRGVFFMFLFRFY